MASTTLPASSAAPALDSDRYLAELAAARAELEADPLLWLVALFEDYVAAGFADHHIDFWTWLWSIRPGVRPDPFIAIWPRGGAKSTSAELACVALGAMAARKYGLYVCETQDQADDHVANVAALLESPIVAAFYPLMGQRMLNKFGASKGWRHNRLRTAAGFTLDAVGLDKAARGVKLEEARPDFMVVDDVDSEEDAVDAVEKKIRSLTRKLFPAGSDDLAVLGIQNLVHPRSIFAKLADGTADFLHGRIVSGPIPALDGMEYSERPGGGYDITAGEPTWAGQDRDTCQEQLDDWGLTAFLTEAQHQVEAPAGGMFDHLTYQHISWAEYESMRRYMHRIVVWVDPAVTNKDTSDSMGIQADALHASGTIYRLWSWEQRTTPLDAICRALRKAAELGAEAVGIETDQGGDTWGSVYREACDLTDIALPWRHAKAGEGHGSKVHRAAQMLADYERGGRIVHVEGTHHTLERGLNRFPKTKPLDLVDAAFWSWHDLRRTQPGKVGDHKAETPAEQPITAGLLTTNF